MEIQDSQLPTEQLVECILLSGELRRIDREQLKLALLKHSISEKELVLIEQVLDKVRKGLLNIVNES